MKKELLLLVLFITSPVFMSCDDDTSSSNLADVAPKVETFTISGTAISADALTFDKAGNIYASNNIGTSSDPFNGNGTTVTKITPEGVATVFAGGLEGPSGSCFDKDGNLFVCTFQGGKVVKISPTGSQEIFAEGLEGPVQIITDSQGNLFVSVAGIGNTVGSKIYKYTPNGTKSTLVDLFSVGGIALGGMVIDGSDNLYVDNFLNGKIHKITPTGTVSVLVDLATTGVPFTPFLSYLAIANDAIYATGTVANRIYKITLSGNVTLLAGTGVEGSLDGTPDVATFTAPNGIAVDPSGDVLYISESTSKRVRKLVSLKKL